MRFAITSPFIPFLRPLAVVPLAVAVWLAIPVPTSAFICYTCAFSENYPWQSWECVELEEDGAGTTGCKTVAGGGHSQCQHGGFACWVIVVTVENDMEAVSNVMAGEDLLADGNHFFVVDGDDAVVMRKCDLTVAARIPHHQIPGFDADLALATNNA